MSKLIKIKLDDQLVISKLLKLSDKCSKIRELLKEKTPNDFFFLFEGTKLDKDDEKEINLESIIVNENEILLQTKSDISKNEIKKSIPKGNFLKEHKGLKIYLYPSLNSNYDSQKNEKCLLVLGETGSGKTTLLNSFVNYIMKVNYEDDFRYYLVDEKDLVVKGRSTTKEVTIYNIKGQNGFPSMKIIDTPGFGDTDGVEIDNIITNKIAKLLKDKIHTLTAVCFIVKSSDSKISTTQKYILAKVMELFGKNIAENFIAMITFCDGDEPPVLEALESKDCAFGQMKNIMKDPWYLEFNNSGIFSKKANKMFWELGMKSFEQLLSKINKLNGKSLKQTRNVIEERKNIKDNLERLNSSLELGISLMRNIKIQMEEIEKNKDIINANKNYKLKIKFKNWRKIPKKGKNITFCDICRWNCHEPCFLDLNESKKECSSMEGNFCKICPLKCRFNDHSNNDYAIEYFEDEKEEILEETKIKYNKASAKKSFAEQILYMKQKEYYTQKLECIKFQNEIKKSIDKLREIALEPNTYKSTEEYIDFCIKIEEKKKTPESLEKISSLLELKKDYSKLRAIFEMNDENNITELKQMEKDIIQYLKNLKADNFDDFISKINIQANSSQSKNCIIF